MSDPVDRPRAMSERTRLRRLLVALGRPLPFFRPGGWLMLPAVLFTVLLIGFPLIYTVYLSLHRVPLGRTARFIGAGNYTRMFDDPLFWNGLWITLVLFLGSLIVQLVLGTYVGLLLNTALRGRTLLRAVLLSPFVMPPVVVGMMWLVLLDPSVGAVNYLVESIGLPRSTWLASPSMVVPTLILIDTWQFTPFVALIVLGGLQAIPLTPYESASIDGATPWQMFVHITVPLLRPALVSAMILRSVDLLRFFDIIYITTAGGPGNASTTLNIYAFRQGFEFFNLGYASSVMIALFVLVLIVSVTLTRFRRAA
jgi:multiple sugar transport system permease protein